MYVKVTNESLNTSLHYKLFTLSSTRKQTKYRIHFRSVLYSDPTSTRKQFPNLPLIKQKSYNPSTMHQEGKTCTDVTKTSFKLQNFF